MNKSYISPKLHLFRVAHRGKRPYVLWHVVFPWILARGKKKRKKKEQSSTSTSGDSHFLEADCSMLRHVHRKMTDASEIDGSQVRLKHRLPPLE